MKMLEPWKTELYHHGILGMKWGKKNGPPYPLAPNKHSASEKKAGWQKSLNENSPSMPQGGAAGGGGPTEEDEEDKKILEELYKELDKENLGFMAITGSGGQNFRLTLAEFTGVDVDKLSDADIERLRKKATGHYTQKIGEYGRANERYNINTSSTPIDAKKNVEKNNPQYEYRKGKLVKKETTPENVEKNNTYTITDKGLQKEEDKTVWDKIKGKIFGETKVTFEDAKTTDKKDENKNTHTIDEVETEWVNENTQKVGNLYVTHDASTVLNTDSSEYKTKTTFKDAINDAKDWVNNLFGKSEKKTMTIQEYTKLENEWRAKGMSEAEIEKKIKDEYSDYTITYPKG